MKTWIYRLLIAVFFGGLLIGCRQEEALELPSREQEELQEKESDEEEEIKEELPIWVNICGEVAQPGVYEMTAGDRLYQIVEKAGGMTKEAQPSSVNLARQLQDGEQIYVYSQEEYQPAPGVSPQILGENNGRININTAGAEELTALSGIGPSKAAAIIAYREQNGGFENIEEIQEVDGIGEGTYQKIKDEIVIS